MSEPEGGRDDLIGHLVRAQDISLIDRPQGSKAAASDLLLNWLQNNRMNEPIRAPAVVVALVTFPVAAKYASKVRPPLLTVIDDFVQERPCASEYLRNLFSKPKFTTLHPTPRFVSMVTKPKLQNHRLQSTSNRPQSEPLLLRLHRALGPIAGGVILDVADFATIGPIGLFAGLFVGIVVGWWVSSIYEFSMRSRILWSFLAGLYCTVPFTALFPLATMISAVGRFRERQPAGENT